MEAIIYMIEEHLEEFIITIGREELETSPDDEDEEDSSSDGSISKDSISLPPFSSLFILLFVFLLLPFQPSSLLLLFPSLSSHSHFFLSLGVSASSVLLDFFLPFSHTHAHAHTHTLSPLPHAHLPMHSHPFLTLRQLALSVSNYILFFPSRPR